MSHSSRKWQYSLIVALCLGLLVVAGRVPTASAAACTTICYVDAATGNDANDGDTPGTAKKTIQAAVNQVTAGGDVIVAAGVYIENVTIPKSLTLTGAGQTDDALGTVLDGSTLTGKGIYINAGVTDVTIENLRIEDYKNATGSGIWAHGSNNNFTVQYVTVDNNGVPGITHAGGVYMNGPVDNVLIDNVTANNNNGRGIEILGDAKTDIILTNNTATNNTCCGIELQIGTASGVTITGNTSTGNSDSGMSAMGLTSGAGPNLIANNTLDSNGRFGLEIRLPDGTGLDTGDGSIVVENNNISLTTSSADLRDYAGIAVFRQYWSAVNANIPTGVIVRNNTVTGYAQNNAGSFSEGFGIAVEGTNMTVTGNTLNNNDVGVQVQGGHLPYVANTGTNGDQSNLNDQFFGRGNSPVGCAAVSGNTFSGNTTSFRTVGTGATAVAQNIDTGEVFCSIQAAIDDSDTVNSHTIEVFAGTHTENVIVNKSVTLLGANAGVSPNDPITPLNPNGARGPETEMAVTGGGIAFNIQVPDVTIDGFKFTDSAVDQTHIQTPLIATGLNYGGDGPGFEVVNNLFSETSRVLFYSNGPNQMAGGIIDDNRVQDPGRADTNCGTSPALAPSNCGYQLFNPWRIDGLSFQGNVTVAAPGSGDRVRTLNIFNSTAVTVADNTIRNTCIFACFNIGAGTSGDVEMTGNDVVTDTGSVVQIHSSWTTTGATINVHHNHMTTGDDFPIAVDDLNADLDNVHINRNALIGDFHARNGTLPSSPGTETLDITCNWWGGVGGPNKLDGLFGPLDYTPWLYSDNLDPNGPCYVGGTITIDKVAAGGGNTAFEFDVSWSTTNITLTDAATPYVTTPPLPALTPPATYSVSEVTPLPVGWTLKSATCDNLTTELVVETVNPSSITVADGDAWICTFTNVYDPTGSITVTKETDPDGGTGFTFTLEPDTHPFLTKWGSNGSGASRFNRPFGVAIDGSGNVYVADHLNHRIQKFDSNGAFLQAWGWDVVVGGGTGFEVCGPSDTCKAGVPGNGQAQFRWPTDVAVDSLGNVFISDYGNNRIQKLDSNGTWLTQWGSAGNGDGQFASPYGLGVDGTGNVYVADTLNHRIQKFDGNGIFIAKWGSSGVLAGQFTNPYGVELDGAGNVYVSDTYNHRIQKFDSNGAFLLAWGWDVVVGGVTGFEICGPSDTCKRGAAGGGQGQFNYNSQVAVDGFGNVFATDTNPRIQKFDSNGAFLLRWGSTGSNDSQFQYPYSVAVDGSNYIYVSDTYNHRIQKFGLSSVVLDDDESHTFASLPPNTYSVTEDVPDGWALVSATCDNKATQTVETVDPASIIVATGDAWECLFTNVQIELTLTPSYLVSRVEEGKTSGDSSMACYWITLPVAPTGNVVVDIAPGPEVTVNKSQVTLNAANWNNLTTANQTNLVCIRAVDDNVDEPENAQCGNRSANMTSDVTPYGSECGDHLDFIGHTLNTGLTTAPGYGSATPWTNNTLTPLPGRPGANYLDVLVVDNDVAGVTLTESFAVTDLDESGTPVGKSCYWVNLTTIPTGPVTVNITPGSLVSTDKASVMLNSSNWNLIDPTFGNTGNFVCITPKDDNVINPPVLPQPCFTGSATMLGAAGSGAQRCGTHLDIIGHGATSGDPKYNATGNIVANGANFDSDTRTIDVILRDDDVLLDRVVYEPATVNLLEGQETTFGVRLSSQPAANVTVSNDLATLTFTPSNWKDLQPVTVSAAQNNTADGPLTSLYPPTVTSDDANFHNAAAPSVEVTVIDDETAGVMLSSTTLSVSEAGQKATYQLSLTNKPTGNVTVSMASDGQLAFAPQSLTFTTQNWDKPQTVTVMAADDVVAEGAHTGRVTHQVSGGGGYVDVVVSDIVINVQDNDTAAVLVTDAAGLTVSEGGQPSAAYHLALQTRPTANVIVTVDGGGRLVAQPATVTFTPANWNVPQAVKLTAIDDRIDDGVISAVTLTHRAASADPFYEGYEPAWQQALVLDNDSAGLKLSQAMVSPLPGGGTATYTVALASKPRADVVVDLVAGGIVDASGPGCSGDDAGTSCLLFTPANWNVPQTVTVSATGQGFITHRFESADAIYGRLGAYRVMVNQPFRLFTPMGSGSSK